MNLLSAKTACLLLVLTTTYSQQAPLAGNRPRPYVDFQSVVIASVRDFGAKGNGLADDSVAIQSAIDSTSRSKPCLFFPPGTYRISQPIRLSGGECLKGENASNLAGSTVLIPATAAFVTANPLAQLQVVTINGFQIRGGTNAIDLGLFHRVDLSDITCIDQSGWCFSHVRGERHRISNIMCWHASVSGRGCLSFADSTQSIFSRIYAGKNWSDQWWDRSTIDHITDLGNSSSISDQYTIWSNGGSDGRNGSFSNSNVRLVLSHKTGQSSPVRLVNVQLSQFHNIATDGIGSRDRPVAAMFDIEGYFKYSEIDGFYPAFSGNSYYTTGLYIRGTFIGSSVRNCSLGGDNKTTFGVRFGQDYGRYGEISSCDGSYYNESTNPLWRDQISIGGSNFKPTNGGANINLIDHTNTGARVTLMADENAAKPAQSSFEVLRASGNGGRKQDFSIGPDIAYVRTPLTIEGGVIEPLPLTPPSANSKCDKGAIRWDSDFIYVCVARDVWKRSPLSKF